MFSKAQCQLKSEINFIFLKIFLFFIENMVYNIVDSKNKTGKRQR